MKPFFTYVLKSPIVHFILLGAVAFAAYSHLKPAGRETITVTSQTIDALVQQRESITRNPFTEKERQDIIEGHIEDEILLREAYKRGFDKNDYRVRKRMLNIMRSSLSEVIPEPSAEQLRAFYQANRERYLTSPSRSFEQVYFSFASHEQPADPDAYIRQLEKTDDISKLGEFSPLGNRFDKTPFERTAAIFGSGAGRSRPPTTSGRRSCGPPECPA